MNSPEIKKFIQANRRLFWYIPEEKKEDISEELLLETILNYGSLESVNKLFDLMGFEKAIRIFREQVKKRRSNYFPTVKNFFELYFERHA